MEKYHKLGDFEMCHLLCLLYEEHSSDKNESYFELAKDILLLISEFSYQNGTVYSQILGPNRSFKEATQGGEDSSESAVLKLALDPARRSLAKGLYLYLDWYRDRSGEKNAFEYPTEEKRVARLVVSRLIPLVERYKDHFDFLRLVAGIFGSVTFNARGDSWFSLVERDPKKMLTVVALLENEATFEEGLKMAAQISGYIYSGQQKKPPASPAPPPAQGGFSQGGTGASVLTFRAARFAR